MRAIDVRAAGGWTGEPVDSVVLDHDDRRRRQGALKGVRGLSFELDLPEAVLLRSGDALALEDGRLVEVLAAPEPLIEIRARDPKLLARVAWTLGDRHAPAQILTSRLRARRDETIAALARSMGADVVEIEAPFDPEGAAYARHAPSHHDHGHHDHRLHDHGHHDHGHHAHDDRQAPAHHDHDHGCGCGHHHDHGHKPARR